MTLRRHLLRITLCSYIHSSMSLYTQAVLLAYALHSLPNPQPIFQLMPTPYWGLLLLKLISNYQSYAIFFRRKYTLSIRPMVYVLCLLLPLLLLLFFLHISYRRHTHHTTPANIQRQFSDKRSPAQWWTLQKCCVCKTNNYRKSILSIVFRMDFVYRIWTFLRNFICVT